MDTRLCVWVYVWIHVQAHINAQIRYEPASGNFTFAFEFASEKIKKIDMNQCLKI